MSLDASISVSLYICLLVSCLSWGSELKFERSFVLLMFLYAHVRVRPAFSALSPPSSPEEDLLLAEEKDLLIPPEENVLACRRSFPCVQKKRTFLLF